MGDYNASGIQGQQTQLNAAIVSSGKTEDVKDAKATLITDTTSKALKTEQKAEHPLNPNQVKQDAMRQQSLHAKNTERSLIRDTMRNAVTDTIESYNPKVTKEETINSLTNGTFIQRKLEDQIRVAKGDPDFKLEPAQLKQMKSYITVGNRAGLMAELKRVLGPEKAEKAEKLTLTIMDETKSVRQVSIESPERYADQLEGCFLKLMKNINTRVEGDDVRKANYEALQILREAFQSDAYQHLKEDESNAYVKMLHDINLKLYEETPLLDAYQEYGFNCMEDAGVTRDEVREMKTDTTENRAVFETKMMTAWTNLKNNKLSKIFGRIRSIVVNKLSALRSQMTSLGYDPRGEGENNAGAFYKETVNLKDDRTGEIVNVFTPSPTLGGVVSPEYRAALQAMQNHRLNPPEELNRSEEEMQFFEEEISEQKLSRPGGWVYVNHQDITKGAKSVLSKVIMRLNEELPLGAESARSKVIMRLNEEFPFSFKGITLTKDSKFYQAGMSHDVSWKKVKQKKFNSPGDLNRNFTELSNDFRKELLHENNFSVDKSHKGKGFYFPGKVEDWKKDIDNALNEADTFIHKVIKDNNVSYDQLTPQDIWELEAVYKEFVYAALSKAAEIKMLQQMGGNKNKILLTKACKENIDRGGAENAKSLWIIGRKNEDVLGCFFSRAAMGRFRAILPHRFQHFRSCIKWSSQDLFNQHLKEYLNKNFTHFTKTSSVESVHGKVEESVE